MKVRSVTIYSGEEFSVPQCVQRIDSKSTHGWQVRYHGTSFFSDGTAGPANALAAATRELARRITANPAPVRLQRRPSANKNSQLPPGISGPIVQPASASRGASASLGVHIPKFGQPAQVRKVYIASESTYSVRKFREALAQAVALRAVAEQEYQVAATKARRKEVLALKASARGLASQR